MIVGSLLGVLLLVESVLTYRSVTQRLVPDHLIRQAGRHVSWIETRARQQAIETGTQVKVLLDDLRQQESGDIAWLRILSQNGDVLAASGDTENYRTPVQVFDDVVNVREQSSTTNIRSQAGDMLVVVLPFRVRLAADRPSGEPRTAAGLGRPRFSIAEVALYLHGATDPFLPLRRNLTVSVLAAVALLASILATFFQLPAYLRGRAFEEQLALARRVQQELLPRGCPACKYLDFAAECIPAWEVGGDFYDVLPTKDGQVGLVLGDVSGKGLPAALLMGTLHGAVRVYAGLRNNGNHAEIASELNQSLYLRTSAERFASLLWAFYDSRDQTLSYVNAGHLPPLVLRHAPDDNIQVQRLEIGGPVLGLLPAAVYRQGEVNLRSGDLLVFYSDGVVEASNAADEEFGEQRLVEVVSGCYDQPLSQIVGAIIGAVKQFSGTTQFQDDLTVLVARIGPSRTNDRS
jgi:serine phosphatase RsbU (regulator of sigma subunit)